MRSLHCIGASSAIVLVAGAAHAQEVQVRLAAASVPLPNGQTEIRLRWPISKGWIPEGGFRLFRGTGNERQLIFPKQPVFRPDVQKLTSISLKGGRDLGQALTRAATKTRSTEAVALFEPPAPQATSSAALFGLRAQTLKKRTLESPFALRSRSGEDEPAELTSYWNRITTESLRARALTPRAPNPDDSVIESRADLVIAAMTDSKVATELGIAATDTARSGDKLRYSLVAVGTGGKETPVAALDFVAGDNPPLPALAGLKAEQVGDGLVALRWERPSGALLQRMGTVGYRMLRADARSPQGKSLTETPFFVTEIPAQGGAVEPIAFFTDDEAAAGSVTYRVSGLDMFGRETPPAEIKLTVEDMRLASAPRLARAALETNKVRVIWQKSTSAGAQYYIWRRDAEVDGSTFVRLTRQPIAGTNPDASAAVRTLAGRGVEGPLPVALNLINTYVDSTAQPDKKYIYAVTAQLPGSKAESAPAETRVVAYPAPAPAAPVVVAPVFKKGTPVKISLKTFQLIKAIPVVPVLKSQRAVAPNENRAELRWTAPAGQANLRYHVYRSEAAAPGPDDWEFRGETTATTFADAIPPGRALTYTYRVNALNRWEIMSAGGKATLNAPPTIPPSAPEVVGVRPDAQGKLVLRLRPAPAEEGVARYRATRKLIRPAVLQLTEPVFVKAFRDRSAGLTTRGEGVVNQNGEPLVVTERPMVSGELKARGGGAPIQVKELPESSDGYVEVALTALPVDASGMLALVDSSVKQGETYFYRVVAETADGLRSEESEALGAQAILPRDLPGVVGFNATATSDGVQLKWNAMANATGYVIVRISTGRPRIYRAAGTSWIDKTARSGVAYKYQIRAMGSGGGVSPVAETTITLPAR